MATLHFAGRRWEAKSGIAGPGANHWSRRNAWVDGRGLHLAIRREKGIWHCAEVRTQQAFGYGLYLFFVDARVDRLDRHAVLGLFTYQDDRNEMDVEIGSFMPPGGPPLVNHTHQHPWHHHHAAFALTGPLTTHRIVWKSTGVEWASWHGHHAGSPPGRMIFRSPPYRGPTPPPGGSRIHLNLWLHERFGAPAGGADVEVVIRDVVHVPGDSP